MSSCRITNCIVLAAFLCIAFPAHADVIAVLDAGGVNDGSDTSFEDLSTDGDTIGDMTGVFTASGTADWAAGGNRTGHWNLSEFDFANGNGKVGTWTFGGLTPDEDWDVYVAWNNAAQVNLSAAAPYTLQGDEIIVPQNVATVGELVLTDANDGAINFEKLGTATVNGDGEIIVTLTSAADAWVICDAVAIKPFALSCDPLSELECTTDSAACEVALSWTLGESAYVSIEVRRNDELIATLAGTDTAYVDDQVTGGAFHTYAVEGICAAAVATTFPTCTVLMPSCEPAAIAVLDAGGEADGSGQTLQDLSTGGATIGDITGAFAASDNADWAATGSGDTRWNGNEYDFGPGSAKTAAWTFGGLTTGELWDVYISWSTIVQANLSQAAPYTIQGGEEILVNQEAGATGDLLLVDARSAIVNLQKLGTAQVDGEGNITVTVAAAEDDWVICDAVAIRPSGLSCDALKDLACTPDSAACEIALGWDIGEGTYTAIEVRRNDELIATLEGTDTGYVDTDVAGEATYTYEVEGLCPVGTAMSVATCTVLMPSCEPVVIALLDAGGTNDGSGQTFEDLSTGGETVGDMTGVFEASDVADWSADTSQDARWNNNEFDFGPGSAKSASWTFGGLTAGEAWDVYISWGTVGQVNLSQAAPYTIQGGEEILVNQEGGAAGDLLFIDARPQVVNFQKLGTAVVNGDGEIIVALSGAADDWVICDAVVITPSDAPPCVALENLECAPNAAAGEVALSWDLGGGIFASIEVRRDGEALATLTGTDTGYLDDSAAAGASYAYEVEGICMVGSASAVTCAVTLNPVFMRGEVNASGNIDLSDAIALLGYLFNDEADPVCFDSADANDSGGLDLSDAIAILGYLFNDEDDLPPPFGSCGEDPTEDDLGCDSFPLCTE